MSTIDLAEKNIDLGELIERARAGEEIVLARAGRPLARLSAYDDSSGSRRRGGRLAGKIWISDDFDDPLPPEIQRAFEGLDP